MGGQGGTVGVGGLVDRPMRLSLSDLRALAGATEYVTMECISNNIGGELMSTGSFTGVRLRDLGAMARPTSGDRWVAVKAGDGYSESLPMSLVQGAPEIIVAYELDGAPLPMSHGFPARMIIPGRYGMKGPKWLDSIDMVNQESGGYWEQQGWDRNAVVKTTARIDMPLDGSLVKLGVVSVSGVAFAGTRGISKVVRTRHGRPSRSEAPVKLPRSQF